MNLIGAIQTSRQLIKCEERPFVPDVRVELKVPEEKGRVILDRVEATLEPIDGIKQGSTMIDPYL